MSEFFKESVKSALKYYVYALVDPRNKCIFYVGKGCGDRIYNHAKDALRDNSDSLKLTTIREIHEAGLEVIYYILRHNLSEKEAFLVESSIIDLLTYESFNMKNVLANIATGHHQWDEGIKTTEEINILYDCPKIEPVAGDRLLLVSLNKSYNQSKAYGVYRRANVYESARKYWVISAKKAAKVDFILGVYRKIVRIVIDVKGYNVCESDSGRRIAFEGNIVTDSPYLNKDVSDYPFGSGGAVTYIPRTGF